MAHTSGKGLVRARVICISPPPNVYGNYTAEFGLQDKNQDVHPGQTQRDGSLRFECELRVKRRAGGPDIAGPYAHGKPGERFLYLTWRYREGDQWRIIRRLKIHLKTITWEQIEAAQREGVLEARVDGRGAASVPLLGEGWTVVKL